MNNIDRKTAIALAKEAGMAGMLTDVVCSLEEIHRLCNLAVAHSRKDAEPVGEVKVFHKDAAWGNALVEYTDAELYDHVELPAGTKLFTHQPEAASHCASSPDRK